MAKERNVMKRVIILKSSYPEYVLFGEKKMDNKLIKKYRTYNMRPGKSIFTGQRRRNMAARRAMAKR